MSYIVVVNPSLFTDQPCIEGVDGIAIAGYTSNEIRSMLVVITILAAAIATTVMAFYANQPFAQAPDSGLNTFFALTVIGALGIPWRTALTVIFIEGLVFIALTAVGAQEATIKVSLEPVRMAAGTDVGPFLTIIGLQAMGIVVDDSSTFATMGNLASNPITIVSIVGLFFIFTLYAANIPGSIITGIVGMSLLGWGPVASGVIPTETGLVVSSSAAIYDITPPAGALIPGFGNVGASNLAPTIITSFFADFLDTAGILIDVRQTGDFLNDDGGLPGIDKPLMADVVGTAADATPGTSTVTTYVESVTSVEEGGRTGLTVLVVTLLFPDSLAIVPLATAIPQYASHIALVVIGVVMLRNVVDIEWDGLTFTISTGITIPVMPFTYPIAYGIATGIVSYLLMKVTADEYDGVSASQWTLMAAFVLHLVVRTLGMLQAQVWPHR